MADDSDHHAAIVAGLSRIMNKRPYIQVTTRVLLPLSFICGCAFDGRYAALEQDLRGKEATIRELETKVSDAERLLQEQDAELVVLRKATAAPRSGPSDKSAILQASHHREAVEQQIAWGRLHEIQIHRLLTGVVPDTAESGRRTFNVVVQPLDGDGEILKIAGELRVTITLVDSGGEPKVIGSREVTLAESRQLWTKTLLSTGFHIPVQIESPAQNQQFLVTATLDMGDGRTFTDSELLESR